jgi:hypothetical protein
VPLRALGLGAGLLGPTSSPLHFSEPASLAPMGGPKQMIRRRGAVGVSSPPPTSRRRLGGGAACSPFALVQGVGRRGGGAGSSGRGAGGHASSLGASSRRIGYLDTAMGSRPPVWRTAMPRSSRVGSVAKFTDLNPASSQSAGMPSGRIRDSGTKGSPVIPFTRTSSSSQERSVPGPHCTRPMSFEPMNQQHRRALCCSGAIRRFKKSLTTCIDVRSPAARLLILSNTSWNSSARDGLALHCFRSSLGPSLGRARRSLASALAITQSSRQFSHLAPPREGM